MSSFFPHGAKQTLQDLFISMLVEGLTLRQKFKMGHASEVEKCYQHEFDFGLRLSCFFDPWLWRALPVEFWGFLSGSNSNTHVLSPLISLLASMDRNQDTAG